jgi:signal transduction histidine kinase
VSAEPQPAVHLDRAWGHIPQGRFVAASQGTFTRRRIERITAIAAGVGCFVLGIQAFLIALSNSAGVQEQWEIPLLVVIFGALVAMCVLCFFRTTARVATGVFAIIFIVFLALWPILTAGSTPTATPEPWPWFLINVATMAAVIAFPLPLQLAWTIGTPLLYGVVRLAQGGFEPAFWMSMVFEVPYSLILGSLLLTLATIFRRMASGVDSERQVAVTGYAQAAEAQAAQEERVAVSALMHDSVLAALIAAERADSPRARSLAVSMAREALEGLADTSTPTGGIELKPMSLKALARGIRAAMADLGVRLEVDVQTPPGMADDGPDAHRIPASVAAAMIRAATQAAANAVQHADAVGLQARVGRPDGVPPAAAAVEVVVSDSGPGFDIDAVPDDRLGISASILARIAAVDGTATIDSGPRGTTVTLRWEEA